MSKPKPTRYTTPAGIAQYPWFTKADTKFNPDGEYKTSLEIKDPAEVATITAFLDEQLALSVAKAKKENPGKKIKETEAYELNEETGSVTLKFKLKAKVTTKSGDEFEQKPALFDSKGKPLQNVNIGGGSTVKIAYEVNPYYTALLGAGVSLRLKAVQVLNLVEFSGGASADSYGFGEEDGFDAAPTAAEENGFEEDTDEKDF